MLFKIFRIFYPFLILFTFFLFFFSYREYRECSESCSVEPFDDKNEKFLTYLPHSQFHNQLIELKNAIVLAYLTNRTLIVPSILQFNHRKLSIAHSPLYQLYNQLNYITNIKKDRLSCDVKESIYCSPDYVRYDNFVMINWEEIFDFSWIKNEIKIIHRGYDFSIEGLFQICDIPINIKETKDYNYTIQDLLQENEDVHVISHKYKYHYKFFDTDHTYKSKSLGKYDVPYLISDLRNRKEKLIHVDTLFGSSKINFNDKEVIKWKFDMNKSLKFSHPILLDVANSIINELGGFGNFLGAHVRTGDGIFRKNMNKIIDLVIENLKILCDSTKKSIDESFNTGKIVNLSLDNCKLQNKQIIFIATDSKNPRKQLKTIYSTFPCIFTLENFENLVDPLKNVTFIFDKNSNTMDFFYPLLDLLVIANGLDVVVTHDSTFSGFAKSYHQILTLNS